MAIRIINMKKTPNFPQASGRRTQVTNKHISCICKFVIHFKGQIRSRNHHHFSPITMKYIFVYSHWTNDQSAFSSRLRQHIFVMDVRNKTIDILCHDSALLRLYWAGDNLGEHGCTYSLFVWYTKGFYYHSFPCILKSFCLSANDMPSAKLVHIHEMYSV